MAKTKKTMNDSAGTQALNVPNTPEGLAFIKLLRKHCSKDCTIKVRGRGSRIAFAASLGHKTTHGTPSGSLPRRFAEWFAVYMRSTGKANQCTECYSRLYAEMNKLSAENMQLKNDSMGKQALNVPNTPNVRLLRDQTTLMKNIADLKAACATWDREWQKERSAVLFQLKVVDELRKEIEGLKQDNKALSESEDSIRIENDRLRKELEVFKAANLQLSKENLSMNARAQRSDSMPLVSPASHDVKITITAPVGTRVSIVQN